VLTLLDVQNDSEMAQVAGNCTTSAAFLGKLGAGIRRLMRRGDFYGTLQTIFVCAARGCVVWPRYVDTVRRINVCKHPIEVKNLWWKFMLNARNHYIQSDDCSNQFPQFCGAQCRMTGESATVMYQDIPAADTYQVRAYIDAFADVGKTLTLFGTDTNGQSLKTFNNDGTVSDGITLTFASPFVATAINIRNVTRVRKDLTQGLVRLFAWDTVNLVLIDLAVYEASETNPEYVRYSLDIPGCPIDGTPGVVGSCPTARGVLAAVKLRFIPPVVGSDIIPIDNLDALKDIYQSLKFKEAGDLQNANAYEASAVRELNQQLRDKFPDNQLPVDFGETGGLRFRQAMI
jgi:hypothetical protein